MESIDKLREWSRWLDRAYVTSDGSTYTVYSHKPYDDMKSCGELMREQCNEIEREISERYRELPVDADGVPIHIGDRMRLDNGHEGEVWLIGAFDIMMSDHVCFDWAMSHHVKPHTLEDVLTDFAEAIEERGTERVDVSQLASEIRELLGVRDD